jgi:hypothetical protein
MKKILLSILFAHITSLGFSQQTYMPDDAFESLVENDQFNNDNYVSTAVISSWFQISMPVDVQDLTGLQDFLNLQFITFQNSNITTIDLSIMAPPPPSQYWGTGITVYVNSCPYLTEVILPKNEISFVIGSCPYLSNIKFHNSNIIKNWLEGNESSILALPSLICLDLSNIADVRLGTKVNFYLYNLEVLKLNNGKCNKWAAVDIITAAGACVSVDNPAFCYTAVSLGSWGNLQNINNPIPGTFSTNCSNCISNLDEIQSNINYSISPNPTTSKITVKSLLKLIGKEFNIYDQLGKEVMSGIITAENTEVDMSRLAEGVYLFKAGTEMQETFRINKQ